MKPPIIVVSGLPRSGTSLMMQILDAGGITPLTDGIRSADHDNPQGYFEWEAIKKVEQDHRVIEKAIGGDVVVKVISALLPKLPKAHRYKVIFMKRDITEVIRSQQKMLISRGEAPDRESIEEASKRLKAFDDKVLAWMNAAEHMDTLIINYRTLIREPQDQISRIIRFLGSDLMCSPEAMMATIDAKLYRNRAGVLDRLRSFFSE